MKSLKVREFLLGDEITLDFMDRFSSITDLRELMMDRSGEGLGLFVMLLLRKDFSVWNLLLIVALEAISFKFDSIFF